MKDTDLYPQILGITPPWDVARVDLDAKALRIDVSLEHAKGKRCACPAGERSTRNWSLRGIDASSARRCRLLACGRQLAALIHIEGGRTFQFLLAAHVAAI